MNPETVIAGLIGLINSIVPEPYAGNLVTATRDYFAALGQQSAEAAKTAAAKENAAAVVSKILATPTVVDSPLPSTPIPPPAATAETPAVTTPAPTPAEPAAPIAPAAVEPAPEAKPEPPKKNNGRNQAPVF